MYINRVFILITVFILLSCSSKFVAHDDMMSSQPSRYSMAQDKAPDVTLAENQIALTTPRKEPLSKYGNKSPYTVNGKTYHILNSVDGFSEVGLASWYGAKFHGHSTSSGETFDMNKISGAHKTLPLPTWVRVTNLDNGRSIHVRVNDRGPFHAGRIIDLSYAAAVKLGYQDKGTAKVKVEVLTGSELNTESYYVQMGAFSEKDTAFTLKKRLRAQLKDKVGVYRSDLYRVRIGPVTYDRAIELQQKYTGTEFGKPLLIAKK